MNTRRSSNSSSNNRRFSFWSSSHNKTKRFLIGFSLLFGTGLFLYYRHLLEAFHVVGATATADLLMDLYGHSFAGVVDTDTDADTDADYDDDSVDGDEYTMTTSTSTATATRRRKGGFLQNNQKEKGKQLFQVSPQDRMLKPVWDGSPIILESHKLIFLTTPKVSCTVFKQLFRRMMGYEDWKTQDVEMPYNPRINGLKYMYQLRKTKEGMEKIHEMLNSPEWTFAVFVRKPHERMLSAYLDKGSLKSHYIDKCYPRNKTLDDALEEIELQNTNSATTNSLFPGLTPKAPRMEFETFLKHVAVKCPDHHWTPQYRQLPPRIWPAIDFIGHMDNLYEDTKLLLQSLTSTSKTLTAWDEFGASGWGPHSNLSIFDPRLSSSKTHSSGSSGSSSGVKHSTNAKTKIQEYYTPWAKQFVTEYYKEDYDYQPFELETIDMEEKREEEELT